LTAGGRLALTFRIFRLLASAKGALSRTLTPDTRMDRFHIHQAAFDPMGSVGIGEMIVRSPGQSSLSCSELPIRCSEPARIDEAAGSEYRIEGEKDLLISLGFAEYTHGRGRTCTLVVLKTDFFEDQLRCAACQRQAHQEYRKMLQFAQLIDVG
jgi:hypothetical protein